MPSPQPRAAGSAGAGSAGAGPEAPLGAGDCERRRRGLIAQPANAWSSLAFVAVAGGLWRRAAAVPDRERAAARLFAVAVMTVGAGSYAYHGPGGRTAKLLHDLSLTAPAAVGLAHRLTPAGAAAVTAAAAGGLTAVTAALRRWPGSSNVITGATAVTAAASEVIAQLRLPPANRAGARRAARQALALAGTGAVLDRLGRTGGPLCRPDSLWQPHAAWHVAAAAALGRLATAVFPAPGRAV